MLTIEDTIVAPITGLAPAAVAIVRLSGPDAWEIASGVFEPWRPEHAHAVLGRLSTGDEGYALPFEAGRSYTGEETVEISLHGSPASVRGLVDALCALGARPAEPGEFTLRAFLSGRIDLTQAEAVRDTVEAQTALQLELASRQRMGGLAMEVSRIREECLRVLAAVEASLDFSDEIGPVDRGSASSTLKTQIEAIDRLLDTARIGRILRQGFRIAILGRPNAGKSSLLNAYLRQDRAIVTPTPGTTRDLIEEAVDFDGLKAVLIDTAGLRDTRDSVEKIGVERARVAATGADLRWYLYDVAAAWTAEDERQLAQLPAPTFRIAAKCDLVEARAEDPLRVSSKTGEGLAALAARSTQMALQGASLEAAVIAPRHEEPLQAAREALTDALGTISAERPDDLAAVGLGHAIAKLGEITGETATPDIIERIFHDFCIGK